MTAVYEASSASARVPLEPSEVEALLLTDAAGIVGSSRAVRHLLTRLRATFAAHADQVRRLQRDIERRAEADRRRANPVTAALDALAALSVDEQRLVYDRRAQVLLDAVDEANQAASRARAAAANETNRARLVLAWAAEREGLDADTRAELTAAVAQLPLMRAWAPVPAPVAYDGAFTVPAAEPEPGR